MSSNNDFVVSLLCQFNKTCVRGVGKKKFMMGCGAAVEYSEADKVFGVCD